MKRALFISLIQLFSFIASVQSMEIKPHPQYSADMVYTKKGKVTDQGKIYIGQIAARIEMPMGKKRQIQIHRWDKDRMWMIMPDSKNYMEMKLQFNALANQNWEGFREECLGNETTGGHPTKKCRVEGQFMGKKTVSTVWKAQDLGGAVIKTVDNKGEHGMELRNIVQASQPSSLFEPPSGYQKMEMPDFDMTNLLKGMTK